MTPEQFAKFIASDQMTDEHWKMWIHFLASLSIENFDKLSKLEHELYPEGVSFEEVNLTPEQLEQMYEE